MEKQEKQNGKMNTGKQQNGKNTAPRHRSAPRRSAAKAPQEMTIEERLRALLAQERIGYEAICVLTL